jgi:hypothetical protein
LPDFGYDNEKNFRLRAVDLQFMDHNHQLCVIIRFDVPGWLARIIDNRWRTEKHDPPSLTYRQKD